MPNTKQIGGDHYTTMAMQPFELISKIRPNFFVGNVIKYISRWRRKNGLEDLQKALHYVEYIIENNIYQGEVPGAMIRLNKFYSLNKMAPEEASIINSLYFNAPENALKKLKAYYVIQLEAQNHECNS